MKTLTVKIVYSHISPFKRQELAEELEEVCEQYGAKIDIDDSY